MYKRQGVDYAIQKGYSQEGKPRYILYFKARDRSAINQAMAAYCCMGQAAEAGAFCRRADA